jgi:hypothetical protein
MFWGPPLEQAPPRGVYKVIRTVKEVVRSQDPQGRPITTEVERQQESEADIVLASSKIAVTLDLEQRRKGLNWFSTYAVDFRARYLLESNASGPESVEVRFPLGGDHAIYDGFWVRDAQGREVPTEIKGGLARFTVGFAPGEKRAYEIAYRSRGTTRWSYQLSSAGQVRDFYLALDTNFAEVNFPAGTLSPTRHAITGKGRWHGEWTFSTLVATSPVGLELPERLNPGPLAARITYFAPVGLLFFFFVVAVLEVSCHGQPVRLTVTEFGLLASLMERPGHVLSRVQLMERAYAYDNLITERTIDTHVKRIRKKFRDAGFDPVETVHGVVL